VPLHELAVSPADLTGRALGLALNAPAPHPLATCRVEHPDGGVLVLGVLGASHLVAVEHSMRRFSEEVSCAAHTHGGGTLPDRADAPGYHLESHTITHDEAGFRRLAQRLRERCASDLRWLGGTFPGDEAALTALAAAPDGAGWRWRSWHLYPGRPGGSVVYTTSTWRP
jgi:Protein of unknown function DUF2617